MKSTIRFTSVAALVFAAATIMTAAPRAKAFGTSTSRPPERTAQRDRGSEVTYVCKECGDGSMTACKAGHTVTCPSCQTKFEAAARGGPAKGPAGHRVVHVNEKGDKCTFVARTVDAPKAPSS